MTDLKLGPDPIVVPTIMNIAPDALESIAQWIEQRGLTVPIGQIVGYKKERFAAFVEEVGTQSIPNNSETTLTFNTTDYDPQKAFDGTSTLTLPYNGLYLAQSFVSWGANSAGSRYHTIKQNGNNRVRDWRAATATAADGADSVVMAFIFATKGDAITASVFQDSGGSLSTSTGCHLGVALLSAYD